MAFSKSKTASFTAVIAKAADAIKAIQANNPASGSKGEQLVAELSFIRGFLTMQATTLWGRVPIEDGSGDYSRKSLKDVWQFIIDDFTMATANALLCLAFGAWIV